MNIKISRELKSAVFAIVTVVLFLWGYNFLKGKDLLKKYHVYYAVFNDVNGIDNSTPVKLRGLSVGSIQSMKFREKDRKIVLTLNIDSEYFIPKDSKVKIEGSGILGGRDLVLDLGFSPEAAKDGDTLQSVKAGGFSELIGNAQQQLEELVFNTNQLIKNLNTMFNDENKANLSATLANVKQLTVELQQLTRESKALVAENRSSIRQTMQSLEATGKNAEKITAQLKDADYKKLLENLTKSTENLNKILQDLQAGKGSLGKLAKDEAFYDNLNKTTESLNALLEDLKQNPKRYVHFSLFGKKDKKKE